MLDAAAVREAYRSSFLGTRYVIQSEAVSEAVSLRQGETLVLRVAFIEAETGRSVVGEGEVKVVPVQ
jgi:hypothetical protein